MSAARTPNNTSAADIVAAVLAAHPDGVTTARMIELTRLGKSTVGKILAAMGKDGAATRTTGPDGTTWAARTAIADPDPDTDPAVDVVPVPTGDEDTSTDGPAPDDATDEPEPADERVTAPEDNNVAEPVDEPDTDRTPTGDSDGGNGGGDEADLDPAPVGMAELDDEFTTDQVSDETVDETGAEDGLGADVPVSAPAGPDLSVIAVAGVLGDNPDGITAAEVAVVSGLNPAVVEVILAAMEMGGAGRRIDPVTDGAGVVWWAAGDGDPNIVSRSDAPTHHICPTCGHTKRLRAAGGGTWPRSTTPGMNNDGSEKLGKGGLRRLVEEFLGAVDIGHEFTAGTIAREIGGRSSGAVANVLEKLTGEGKALVVGLNPMRYATARKPVPAAEVPLDIGPVLADGTTDLLPAGSATGGDTQTASATDANPAAMDVLTATGDPAATDDATDLALAGYATEEA